MKNTITRKEMLTAIIEKTLGKEITISDEEIVKFCQHQIELLDNKTSSKKPTKTQEENVIYKEFILNFLTTHEKSTVSDIMTDSNLAELSNQRITSLLTQLRNDNKVTRIVEKKKAYYSIM